LVRGSQRQAIISREEFRNESRQMPRSYFNTVFPGRLIPDHYGHELLNLAAAQSKAHTLAQQMLARAEHWRKAEFSIMSNGHEVARVPFARLEALPLNGPAAIMSGFKSAKRAACSRDRPWAQSELNAAVKGVSFGLTVVMARDHHPFWGAP
jgi:hypothetical protein